jgi:hypothetical protein
MIPFVLLQAYDHVVIWGHKNTGHTHSYIHGAFYKAFKHLGYDAYWVDTVDELKGVNLSNTLFLTEGQVEKGIPIRSDGTYILHNSTSPQNYKGSHFVTIQVYTHDVDKLSNLVTLSPFIIADYPGKVLYMPWATDLLPHEIDQIKTTIPFIKKGNDIWWVGTVGEGEFGNVNEINPFIKACKENNIDFRISNPWVRGISTEEHIKKIQTSFMAPTIVGTWQKKQGYIPCRIFKNISYGQWGITNSKTAYEILERKITYNPNTYKLFYDALLAVTNLDLRKHFEVMDFVRDNHTYINRIETILNFIEDCK